jgi:uncharacterized membrane protein
MKTSSMRYDFAACATFLAGCAFTGFVYTRLPHTIATHFDMNGEPNGFMSRLGASVSLPLMTACLWVWARVLPRLADKNRTPGTERVSASLGAALVVFTMLVHAGLLMHAIHESFPLLRGVLLGASALFVVKGLLLPRASRNAWLGFRNAWTLTSDEVWSRTHRFGGQLFVVSGIVSGASALIASTSVATAVIVASAVVTTASTTVFAWWTHRALDVRL